MLETKKYIEKLAETVADCEDGDWPLEPVEVYESDGRVIVASNGGSDTPKVLLYIDPITEEIVDVEIRLRASPV